MTKRLSPFFAPLAIGCFALAAVPVPSKSGRRSECQPRLPRAKSSHRLPQPHQVLAGQTESDIDVFADQLELTGIAESDNCQGIALVTLQSFANGIAVYHADALQNGGTCHAVFSGTASGKPVGKTKIQITLSPS